MRKRSEWAIEAARKSLVLDALDAGCQTTAEVAEFAGIPKYRANQRLCTLVRLGRATRIARGVYGPRKRRKALTPSMPEFWFSGYLDGAARVLLVPARVKL